MIDDAKAMMELFWIVRGVGKESTPDFFEWEEGGTAIRKGSFFNSVKVVM